MAKHTQTLIQQYSGALVKNLYELSDSISEIKHNLTKREIRELFVTNILNKFLTSQFGIGAGSIINQNGQESTQSDIIIYDNRVLPPFIREHNIGVFPVESAIATIEIKSKLPDSDLIKAETNADYLRNTIWSDEQVKPLCFIFALKGNGPRRFAKNKASEAKKWLSQNIKNLLGICVLKKFSWMNVTSSGWGGSYFEDLQTYEETKRFIAVTLDNIRTLSQKRLFYILLIIKIG